MGPGEICRSMFAGLERAGWDTLHITDFSGSGLHAGGAQSNHMIQVFETHVFSCMHEHTHTLDAHLPEDWTG